MNGSGKDSSEIGASACIAALVGSHAYLQVKQWPGKSNACVEGMMHESSPLGKTVAQSLPLVDLHHLLCKES